MAKKSKKILIIGDSFACEWPNGLTGWPAQLAQQHDVTNLAQAGVGEYKILRQLLNFTKENPWWQHDYDCVIVCHTSPSRVHTPVHPIHKQGLHKDCDLIWNDIESRNSWFNKSLDTAKNWFKYHYDDQYQKDIYRLIRRDINKKLEQITSLHIDNFGISNHFVEEQNLLDFSMIWPNYRGEINHYNDEGNQIVLAQIVDKLEQIC